MVGAGAPAGGEGPTGPGSAERARAAAPLPAEATGGAPGLGRLSGRRILVVGGGQSAHGLDDPPIGNGRATAVLFAREGAAVAIADTDRASAEVTAAMVDAEGATSAVLTGDASDPDDMEAVFSGAAAAVGPHDGVVLNVGIGAGFLIRGATAADWDRVMAVNVRAHFLGCRLALACMERGSVVLIGSIAAHEVLPVPAYGASKAALGSLCRQAAVEGAPHVRVNLLEPGLIDTSLGRAASALDPRREQVRIPARRQGTGWEVAQAALFLMSDQSSYVTGQRLIVDGGLTVGPRG